MHYLHKHNRFLNFGIKERMMNKICLFIILVFLCFTSAFAKDFFRQKGEQYVSQFRKYGS